MAEKKHPSSKRYPPEMRERAVRMVQQSIEETGERWGVVSRVARQLGIGEQTLRNWVERADVDAGRRPGVTTEGKDESPNWKRRTGSSKGQRNLEVRFGFFRGGARPPKAVVRYIDAHKAEFGVEPICRVLQVAPSTYYAAKSRPPSARAVATSAWARRSSGSTTRTTGSTGSARSGASCSGRMQVGRDQGGGSCHPRDPGRPSGKAKRTTIPGDLSDRPADLVDRQFFATAPNRLWLADITYVLDLVGLLLHQLYH